MSSRSFQRTILEISDAPNFSRESLNNTSYEVTQFHKNLNDFEELLKKDNDHSLKLKQDNLAIFLSKFVSLKLLNREMQLKVNVAQQLMLKAKAKAEKKVE